MKVLIAIIAYNESRNITKVFEDLSKYSNTYDVIVIDNSSSDSTKEICVNLNKSIISHSINSGSAFGTVVSYFQYANRYNYDVVCQFDGDGQHIADQLHKIIAPIEKGNVDYVIGSRFLEKKGFQSYFIRRIGINLFAKLDSLIIGQKVTDVTSGFRAYGRNVIELFGNYYKHEIFDTNQLLLLSHFAGAKILEVPVQMRDREHGESEFNLINSITYPFKGVINILGTLLQRKQIKKTLQKLNGN